MSKDKKKKKDDKDHKEKKHGKKANGSAFGKAPKAAAKSLQSLTQNPLVADVVAAALVSMAAALKDSDKARRMASDAGEQLSDLSKSGAKHGGAMWDLALDIGRRTIETLAGEQSASGKSGSK
jgi:hypothetical protein